MIRAAADFAIATVVAVLMLIAIIGFFGYVLVFRAITGRDPDMGRMFDL